ncbi:MAG: hypothetical protein WBH44_11985 [Proteocatella sp.]
MKANTVKRYAALLTGTTLISLGVAIFLKSGLGADPFSLFCLGLSSTLGISFMAVQWLVNIIILSGVYFIDVKKIYIATIINMIAIAPLIAAFVVMLSRFPDGSGLTQNLVIVSAGCVVLSAGAGMYIASNLGFAPYDLVAIIAAEKKQIHYRWARVGTDTLCVLIGSAMGEAFGIGTVIAAFCMGPLIEFFKISTEKYFLKIDSNM